MQDVPTKLPLARFFGIIGMNPLHAQGVYIDELSRNANNQLTCGLPIFQYSWQNADAVGRDDVARAIFEAEADIESVLGYRLLPSWEEDEWAQTTRPYRKELFNLNNRDIRGLSQVVTSKWGHVISGGIRSVEVLSGGAGIAYSADRPPTAYTGLATVTFTPSTELPDCGIALYYPGHPGDERWRIRPVEVTHDLALLYTATFRRELAVNEDTLLSLDLVDLRGLDGKDNANFLTTVDVCRVYNDPQQQATMLWEGRPACGTCGSSGTDCSVCGYATQTACLLLRGEPRLGQLAYNPATWDSTALAFTQAALAGGRQPDLVRLWYYSGWRDRSATCPTVEMDNDWARIVAYMAAARLDRPICACTKPSTDYWATDLAFAGGANETGVYRTTERDLGNPLGTRRGEIMAWRRVRHASIRGVQANVR